MSERGFQGKINYLYFLLMWTGEREINFQSPSRTAWPINNLALDFELLMYWDDGLQAA